MSIDYIPALLQLITVAEIQLDKYGHPSELTICDTNVSQRNCSIDGGITINCMKCPFKDGKSLLEAKEQLQSLQKIQKMQELIGIKSD